MILDAIRERARAACEKAFDHRPEVVAVEFPDKFGDLAVNCFYLAKALRQAPPKISAALAEHIVGGPIASAEPVSGYLNLTLTDEALFSSAIGPALSDPTQFGSVPRSDDAERFMVEFSAPNTNKPQHLGHIRNNCLGDSVARLVEASGREVVRVNLVNDRGIHICKSMLAYQREGQGEDPTSTGEKGDHFVGRYYVLYDQRFREEFAAYKEAHPEAANMTSDEFSKVGDWGRAAHKMLQDWEADDPETVKLWTTMNSWVMAGFEKTYADLGIAFDRIYFESETYKLGKEIIDRGLSKGIFYKRDDGAVEIDLTEWKLDKKVVLRSDGTSVYMTQDVGTTVMKFEEFQARGQIWVVGDEQIYHFKVLFKILELLGYEWSEGLHHLAYGMVHLPDGKMKSREGKVVDADDLIKEVTDLARTEILARDADAPEAEERARKIGIAALKFMILSVSPQTTMTYDPKASVKFEGDTGPYVLYAYARIRRMITDAGLDEDKVDFPVNALGHESERRLALELLQFPNVVARAAKDHSPSHIAGWLLRCARAYHSHNTQVKILKAENDDARDARLALSRATAIGLRRGLELMGIDPVERM